MKTAPSMAIAFTGLLALVLLLAWTPAAGKAPSDPELESLAKQLDQLVSQLQGVESLAGSELEDFKQQLARLQARLAVLIHGDTQYPDNPPLPEYLDLRGYPGAVLVVQPKQADFHGWQAGSNVEAGWGEGRDVVVTVDNVDYTARWTFPEAYIGTVSLSAEPRLDGTVLVAISDEEGSREIVILSGGLGPVVLRGDAVREESVIKAVPALPVERQQPWHEVYREQADAGSLEPSAAVDWFYEQWLTGGYESDALRDLGERLRVLEGQTSAPTLVGTVRYYLDGADRVLEVPDPWADPAGFSEALERLELLTAADVVCRTELLNK